jgi:lysophospholipase L1-like esterase
MRRFLFSAILLIFSIASSQGGEFFLHDGQRVLFLGDSITQDGRYVENIEAWLLQEKPAQRFEIIKLGLSSETVEGLTEPGHPYPRPNIHDRLDSALEKTKPDIVVACYAMNDGIYHPFSPERFAAYQDGIRKLAAKIQGAKARVVLLTPPPFDALAAQKKVVGKDAPQFGYQSPYQAYDSEVLLRYGIWLKTLRSHELSVVDVHKPMIDETVRGRRKDPAFTLAADGVHPGDEGHWIMAQTVLKAWGVSRPARPRADILGLVHEKWQVLGPAWLYKVGHKRNPEPVDFETARGRATEIEAQARELARHPAR